MKKALSVFLTLALVFQVSTTTAPAFANSQSSTITITLSDGTIRTISADQLIVTEDGTYIIQGTIESDTDPAGIHFNPKNGSSSFPDAVIYVKGDVISDVAQGMTIRGNSTVEVDGNVVGGNSAAIDVGGDAQIYVHGNVVGDTSQFDWVGGIQPDDPAPSGGYVEVDGNVTGGRGIVADNNMEVVVHGDVEGTSQYAIRAGGDAEVTVDGDVTGANMAIDMPNPTSERLTSVANGDGTYTTTVIHDVVGRNDADVYVGGDVTSQEGTTVYVEGNGTLEIAGDVTYEGHNALAVWATGSADIDIHGDVHSTTTGVQTDGEATVYREVYETHYQYSDAQDFWMNAWNNEPGLSFTSDQTRIDSTATVNVDGSVDAERNGIHAASNTTIEVGQNVTANNVAVSTSQSGTAIVHGDATAVNGHAIIAENTHEDGFQSIDNGDGTYTIISEDRTIGKNNSTIQVDGDVSGAISAAGNANVSVGGDVNSAAEADSAVTASGNANVHIQGNVYSNGGGIETSPEIESSTQTMISDVQINSTHEIWENWEHIDQSQIDFSAVDSESTAKIIVDQDVIAGEDSFGAKATGKSTIEVKGQIEGGTGVIAWDHSSVIAEQDVIGYTDAAIDATDTTKVTVDGDVIGQNEASGVLARGESKIAVGGSVKTEEGVALAMDEDANVKIEGDVTSGASAGVQIYSADQADGQLVIKGSVSSEDAEAIPFLVTFELGSEDEAVNPEEVADRLPDVFVYEIKGNEDNEYFDVESEVMEFVEHTFTDEETGDEYSEVWDEPIPVELSEEDQAALVEAVAQAIQYIIYNDNSQNLTIDQKYYNQQHDLYASHEEENVTITTAAADGYEVTVLATGNSSLTKNEDGTWTLIVHRGGGVTISAIVTAIVVEPSKPAEEEKEAENAPAAETTEPTETAEIAEIIETPDTQTNATVVFTVENIQVVAPVAEADVWTDESEIGNLTADDIGTATIEEAFISIAEGMEEETASSVEIVGIDDVLTVTEMAELRALPLNQQMLVSLVALGFGDALLAEESSQLNDDAKQLAESIRTRLETLSPAELNMLLQPFMGKVTYQGQVVDGYIIELAIRDGNGNVQYKRLSFVEMNGNLILVNMEYLR